jgi:hypothetical protein
MTDMGANAAAGAVDGEAENTPARRKPWSTPALRSFDISRTEAKLGSVPDNLSISSVNS